MLKDDQAIKMRNFELEKALNYQNSKLFHRLGYSWELSEFGSYLKLNLSLRRVHSSTAKTLKGHKGNADLEDLSVIREESTNRQQTTDKGYANMDDETSTIRTNRITAADMVIYEEDEKSMDDSHLDSQSTKFEEEPEEEKDQQPQDLKTQLKLNLGDVKTKPSAGNGDEENWDDFGDVLMSTDRKFLRK